MKAKLNICGNIVEVDVSSFSDATTEQELRTWLESHYHTDAVHFLSEHLTSENTSFVWSADTMNMTDEERALLFKKLYHPNS